MNIITLARSTLLGIFALGLAAIAAPAQAGVATTGAVLLDPFDPVPEIQFHHFGGYGCDAGCGGYSDCGGSCGGGYRGCDDGCHRHYRRHRDCDGGCGRVARDDCDRDCDHDGRDGHDGHEGHDSHDGHDGNDDGAAAAPCQSDHCYNAEHYERRWRDGDRAGQEWMDRGTRERSLKEFHGDFYGHNSPDWHDNDDAPPPPPPPPPPDDHHDHHDHHDGH